MFKYLREKNVKNFQRLLKNYFMYAYFTWLIKIS